MQVSIHYFFVSMSSMHNTGLFCSEVNERTCLNFYAICWMKGVIMLGAPHSDAYNWSVSVTLHITQLTC